jgi:hypothetical protein
MVRIKMEMEMKYTRIAYGKQRTPLEGNMLICEGNQRKKGMTKGRLEGTLDVLVLASGEAVKGQFIVLKYSAA